MKHSIFLKLLAVPIFSAAVYGSPIDFNFDSDTLGTSTTFTDTIGGLSATFSSSADPGGFVIYPSIFETLTGNVLGDPGPDFLNDLSLDVNFSQDLSALTLDFATADFSTPSPLTISAFENTTPVGSVTSTGQFVQGFAFPEGEIAFGGATFNNIVISSPSPDLAVDNITVLQATAPEPGTFTMLAAGLTLSGIGIFRRRRRSRG